MATRQMGFGLSRELAEKNAAKYSLEDEVFWILFIEKYGFQLLNFI